MSPLISAADIWNIKFEKSELSTPARESTRESPSQRLASVKSSIVPISLISASSNSELYTNAPKWLVSPSNSFQFAVSNFAKVRGSNTKVSSSRITMSLNDATCPGVNSFKPAAIFAALSTKETKLR